ncbi:MAG: hypothetical protein ACE5NN_04985 [Candidatus Bathyarchaeia archaeon]
MFDEVLRILEDGRWHEFAEITDESRISESKVLRVVKFLNKYGFAQVDSNYEKVRLNPDFLRLPI